MNYSTFLAFEPPSVNCLGLGWAFGGRFLGGEPGNGQQVAKRRDYEQEVWVLVRFILLTPYQLEER